MEEFIQWSDIFEICPEIDKQHKKLIQIINELHQIYLLNILETAPIAKILKQLQDYSIYHFSTEENLFKIYNYSRREEHTREHLSFVTQIGKFTNRYKNNDLSLSTDLLDYLKKWLLEHILNDDKKYLEEICTDNKLD